MLERDVQDFAEHAVPGRTIRVRLAYLLTCTVDSAERKIRFVTEECS